MSHTSGEISWFGRKDPAGKAWSFLITLLLIFLILFAVERKYLLRKTELLLTKEELHFYLKVNCLITFLVFIAFVFILFLF